MNHFGEYIRKLREERNVLQRQLAALLETDTAFISKFEKGEKKATREQASKLTAFFDVSENESITLWLSDKIKDTLQNDPFSEDALELTKKRLTKNK
jgi:HTH-type transcriptional regulator, competence development regulator